ncbi:uncharacterized protein PV09_04283 [Verruconis gallopava]|uniref:Uncharacterized protein n=1 Tax=Verruconis gallopava TaxID=253628 RepID=A0A0D2AZL9_9PEZI|nr:uncharacterized protein PV09_04283 [Verruconis gallopava]KIW04529.1 hypothetical protein PV09_04283 [Verruconis gallopava]
MSEHLGQPESLWVPCILQEQAPPASSPVASLTQASCARRRPMRFFQPSFFYYFVAGPAPGLIKDSLRTTVMAPAVLLCFYRRRPDEKGAPSPLTNEPVGVG